MEFQPHQTLKSSVERRLFDAFVRTKLIGSADELKERDYSRGGRTDSGVSAAGNVIALFLALDAREKQSLLKRVNSALPNDIAVTAWTSVADTFSARYDCTAREYRFYFCAEGLDVERMRAASAQFVGTHNFRNFCKWHPKYARSGTVRTISACEVIAETRLGYERLGSAATQLAYLRCVADGFLWHQLRLMMNALKAVGAGRHAPALIAEMLAAETETAFENTLAPGDNLVLYDCRYSGLVWNGESERDFVARFFAEKYQNRILELKVFSSIFESFQDFVFCGEIPFVAKHDFRYIGKRPKKEKETSPKSQ